MSTLRSALVAEEGFVRSLYFRSLLAMAAAFAFGWFLAGCGSSDDPRPEPESTQEVQQAEVPGAAKDPGQKGGVTEGTPGGGQGSDVSCAPGCGSSAPR